jgi:hypothetical protein
MSIMEVIQMTNQIQAKGHTLIRFKWIDLDGKVWEGTQPASWVAKFAETRRCFDFKALPDMSIEEYGRRLWR